MDHEAEEDKFRDILLILDLLINLMSKDQVDFGLSGKVLLLSILSKSSQTMIIFTIVF